MLEPEEIAAMQADAAAGVLPDVAIISRPIRTDDGEGGKEIAWAVVDIDVPCRVDPPGGLADRESVVAEQLTTVIRAKVTLPAGQDVTERDQLEIGDTTYEVGAVLERGEWEITRGVLVSVVAP